MNFVTYESIFFSNLSSEEKILLTAETDIMLSAVNICNKIDDNIRINLVIERDAIDYYLIKNVLLQKNESKNLMSIGDIEIFLQANDLLKCFSNDYNSYFDCSINFMTYNEDNKTDDTSTTDGV